MRKNTGYRKKEKEVNSRSDEKSFGVRQLFKKLVAFYTRKIGSKWYLQKCRSFFYNVNDHSNIIQLEFRNIISKVGTLMSELEDKCTVYKHSISDVKNIQ